jgi:hypothetical protein
MLRRGQCSAELPCSESWRSTPGTHAVRVNAVVRMADVGRTHRASSSPGGRKASWRREGASRRGCSKHRVTRRTGGQMAKRCAGLTFR